VTRADAAHSLTVRDLQSLLGLSRGMITGLIAAGFVTPARGPRNTLRFTFQDVVLLRTALQLRAAQVPARRINQALRRLRADLPDELPLSGVRVTAVGNEIAVRTGPAQWDALTGQQLFDFEIADIKGDVVFLESTPQPAHVARQAHDWYELAGQLLKTDVKGAEEAYRHAIERAEQPFYAAYVDLGVLLCEIDGRGADALQVLDTALGYFPGDPLLHFNRAVALESLERLDDARLGYQRCLELNPNHADAHHNLALLLERLGDRQGLVRHLNAYRRLTT
jgi:tetratricopeptide (TPR) repeat protein